MLIHVCASTGTCVCACMHACIPKDSPCCSTPLFYLCESLSLSLYLNFPGRLGWLVNSPTDLPVSASLMLTPQIIDTCHYARLFPRQFWGSLTLVLLLGKANRLLAELPPHPLPLLFYIHSQELTWKASGTASRQMLGSVSGLPFTQRK